VQRGWTRAELTYLRGHYYDRGAQHIAARFGRTLKAVLSKAKVLRILKSRCWRADELAFLREHYRKRPAVEMAAELGRSLSAVYQTARRWNLQQPPRHLSPDDVAELGRLHGEGFVDTEIARCLGFSREAIRDHRSRLGLPLNQDGVLRLKRQAVWTQWARLGITSAGQLRALAFRRFALENGWPEDLRPREVQVLNALAAHGVPMTRWELARGIGMRTDRRDYAGRLVLLSGNGPGGTYTASLARRGLVTILWRAGPQCKAAGKGCGQRLNLYALGPEALAMLERRAACESRTNLQRATAI